MADAPPPAPAPATPTEPEATPLSEVWAKDCRVRHVTVLGASRTKDYVVLREMEPVRAQAQACVVTWGAERERAAWRCVFRWCRRAPWKR
jgi:hypothetical protein